MFPLRTSVELFRDPVSPEARLRAKQGAVLYERLVFETGLFDATISEGGSFHLWRPGEGVGDEEWREARTLVEEGSPMQVAFGVQPAKGVEPKAEDMQVMMEGPISRHYVAEWESVIRELEPLNPDWVETYTLPDQAVPRELKREIGELNFSCLGDRDVLPGVPSFLRQFIYKSFHHDSVIAEHQDAAFNVTSQFAPMIGDAAAEGVAGDAALEVWAPGLAKLPWERVIEFRDHPGSEDARARLRELELKARSEGPSELGDLKTRIGDEVATMLTQVIQDLRPKFGLDAVQEALETGVSTLVPLVRGGRLAQGHYELGFA